MKIANFVHRDVTSCSIHDSLACAAQQMWDHDIGCLPVIDDQGHVAGMVTDRDVCMAAYFHGTPLQAIPVTAAMAKRVFWCAASDDIESVARTMGEQQIRRMPVVDEQGRPIGVVSLSDLARAAAKGRVSPADIASTLAAVSAPRTGAGPAA